MRWLILLAWTLVNLINPGAMNTSACSLTVGGIILFVASLGASAPVPAVPVTDSSPLHLKARYLQQDLLDKHWLAGLYVSIVPAAPPGARLPHTVNEPGNVIHAGVWTGRYLGGVGYHYAVTKDPQVRARGGQILRALRILQEVTGQPGLLARGYVKGHGPVEGWEREGRESPKWHQGQGQYADYRWHGDVSVDNFNAVLYGYAIYFDLAADAAQRRFIAQDVDRLMTHLLDHQCRIIDVDGNVTQWGHVGIDPDPARDDYYRKLYEPYLKRRNLASQEWRPSLRASLMLLPDLLIASHITGKPRYLDFYRRVVARFKDNPDPLSERGPFSLERLARVDHSSEGQAYEALYNLVRYEHDPELLKYYRPWVAGLWEMNWMEGNPLFTWMTLSLLPEYRAPQKPGACSATPREVPHGQEGLRLARETLRLYPVDRVLRPVMNSSRREIELNPFAKDARQSARPIPINERPLDNEYAWKGNPYQLDGWLKPVVTMFRFSCDDPQVAWFCDSAGGLFLTLDGGQQWRDVSLGLMGARVQNIAASTNRTFILHAQTDKGVFITRDGGMSWRAAADTDQPPFITPDFKQWQSLSSQLSFRINDDGQVIRSTDGGRSNAVWMNGWRIPRAGSLFVTPQGVIASGPGGCYRTRNGETWIELRLWHEEETGAGDFLHAYWMGRYYGFIGKDE
ncbi:MAG: WD40/YVTN/BNR-like repeat-containing protein [Limisphaerales bacterium]